MADTARRALLIGLVAVVTGCGAPQTAVQVPTGPPATPSAARASLAPSLGTVIPAPGSASAVFAPHPSAIVVFIDPGHGGCLDWGVPSPHDNTLERAEKTMTLAIGRSLRDLLEADGVTVVLSRTTDAAIAGDLEPDHGCAGEPFRDVNGDGETGFDPEGFTLARDELTARIDLANLARADVFISIHINSMTENGEVHEIAATQTFFTDETPWGAESERLAHQVQEHVVDRLASAADYSREDRGVQAINYFVIAPPLLEPTEEEPNVRKRPRGIQMPGVLAEVGSISLDREAELLAARDGQTAVAEALHAAIADFLHVRPVAVRYDARVPGGEGGRRAEATPGEGPPFSVPVIAARSLEAPLGLRLTNTGTEPWPRSVSLAAGWTATHEPYLVNARQLEELAVDVPALGPGESVDLEAELPAPRGEDRNVLWLTLVTPDGRLDELGSPPLQLAWEGS